MEITNHPDSRRVDLDDLARELNRLLRNGLPASDRTAGVVLPNLRNVVARALHPDDPISRIDSLNTLLVRLLDDFDNDDPFAQPARILFGHAPGFARTTLTIRREGVCTLMNYDVDHFRKRVEPEIVRAVAERVYRDMLRFKKRVTGGDRMNAYATWALTDDDITTEEELASLVWKFAYAVRSELIGARRQETEPGFETRVAEHRAMAAKFSIALERALTNYRGLFGPIIEQSGVEYRVEALAALIDEARGV